MDQTETLKWLQPAVFGFLRYLRNDPADLLPVLDGLPASRTVHDVLFEGQSRNANVDLSERHHTNAALTSFENGVLVPGQSGHPDFATASSLPVNAGTNLLVVNGVNAGMGAFDGVIRIRSAAVSPVPEPTTWAMMLIGFAAVGFSMRTRKVRSGRHCRRDV